MEHLPKQALFLGRALRARFDCTQQPLPDQFNVLLCRLDGAEQRRRVQARCNVKPIMKLDLPTRSAFDLGAAYGRLQRVLDLVN